jgi:iron-sulfur cluster assembly protein
MQILTLTEAAADYIQGLLKDKPETAGLRIGLKKGGCAGMEYTMALCDDKPQGDDLVEDKGARVFIEPTATLYLLGTQMDYEITKLRSGFIFNNPNQVSACGCGESVELVASSR